MNFDAAKFESLSPISPFVRLTKPLSKFWDWLGCGVAVVPELPNVVGYLNQTIRIDSHICLSWRKRIAVFLTGELHHQAVLKIAVDVSKDQLYVAQVQARVATKVLPPASTSGESPRI